MREVKLNDKEIEYIISDLECVIGYELNECDDIAIKIIKKLQKVLELRSKEK